MKHETPAVETHPVVAAWYRACRDNRGTDRFRVSYTAFRSLVSGRMPTMESVARAASLSISATAALVHAMADEGRVILDADGDVIGAGGLSIGPARHTLSMFGRDYGVWCALDAVGIAAGLEADARITSRCADTGESVVIACAAGVPADAQPPGVMISLVRPVPEALREKTCAEIQFYAGTATMPASALPLSVAEAAALGRHLWHDGVPL